MVVLVTDCHYNTGAMTDLATAPRASPLFQGTAHALLFAINEDDPVVTTIDGGPCCAPLELSNGGEAFL